MSTRSRIVIALLLVGAAAGGFAYTRRAPKSPVARFTTKPVEQGRIKARVTATGTLSALVTVQVGSQVSGRIQSLEADFNTQVKKGQVIAVIDPQLFKAALEQARANRIAAAANLAKAKAQALDADRQYQRNKALRAQNLIAQADLDTAESNAAVAKAQVEAANGAVAQASAAQHQAEVNLAYTTIVSPIDGVVISRDVDVGQTVAAAMQAPTLFTIAQDLTKMQVDTSVAEADVGKLQPGGPATFTVDAWPNKRFTGRIRQIRNAPQTVQNVVTYDAVIDVDNPDLDLKPGMTANVTFTYADRTDAIRVPNAALRFHPPTGAPGFPQQATDEKKGSRRQATGAADAPEQRTLWVLRGDQPAQVTVQVGITDGSYTEILGDTLHLGDQVITDLLDAGGASGAGGSDGAKKPPRMRMF